LFWTENAIESFCKVVDYLFDNWSSQAIEIFELETDKLIERVASFNQICSESKLFGYRKCVIDSQNSMIYYILNNKLPIVNFIDNRSQNFY
jgi:plasmid stabilization system protein ParE